MSKVFIGTVGYHNLLNHPIGMPLPQLQKMNWADGVDVNELNWLNTSAKFNQTGLRTSTK